MSDKYGKEMRLKTLRSYGESGYANDDVFQEALQAPKDRISKCEAKNVWNTDKLGFFTCLPRMLRLQLSILWEE